MSEWCRAIDWCHIQVIFSRHAQCSCDRLWIYFTPDQNKAVMENELRHRFDPELALLSAWSFVCSHHETEVYICNHKLI